MSNESPSMIARALERVLSDRLGVPVTCMAEPRPISGGFWASIYGFDLVAGDGELPPNWTGRLVLRVMPSRERAAHETIVQRAVAENGFPTPRVLHDGFDEGLGGAFMVMPFASGKPPMEGLQVGSLLSLPKLLRRLPVQLADVALHLHAIDPQQVVDALQRAGFDADGRGANSRLAAIDEAVQAGGGGFDQLLVWFDERRPKEPPLVLCHGDLHPFNLLIDDSGRTMVLDWTNGDVMPREFEVGFTAGLLRCAPIGVPRVARPALRKLTRWLSTRFVAAYEQQVPLNRDWLSWFEALQHARCLAEVVTARCGLSVIVDEQHPFETAADSMIARLAEITGITVGLPVRRPAPTS